MSLFAGVIMIAIMCAMACALPGTFLVLRHQSMLVDAMSHSVLPGIVLGALLTHSTHSFVMAILAALMGIIVVLGANWLRNTGLIAGDANQGLLFPVLFALGVIMLSSLLAHVHICEDTVLTGEMNLNALPGSHVIIKNYSFGPEVFWQLLGIFLINALYVGFFYQVLKLSTFDPLLAKAMGFPVQFAEWGLMFLVSLTVVVAFNAAGAILVVALVIVPPAGALLISKSLPQMIVWAQVIAVGSALAGFLIAYQLDLPTSAMMAVVDGLVFLIILAAVKGSAWFVTRRLISKDPAMQAA